MSLDTTDMYYQPPSVFQRADWITELLSLFPRSTFYSIRRSLKGYMPEDNTPTKTRGWKVDIAAEAVRSAFTQVHPRPGEFLSFDEGMGQCSATRELPLPDNSLHSGQCPDSGQMLSYALQADQEQPDWSKVTQQFLPSNKSIQTAVNLTQ